ncbi:MAG TPA: glycosyltransferase [Smithella sp.]|nr:glycosyltransferase [Smithella sp.]
MKPTISIITVTYNAVYVLPGLIDSIRAQTDRGFEWVVADGASTDGTVELLNESGDVITRWISEPDFGIYHAMNKALQMMTGEYYLVVGADDRLHPDAIAQYRHYAQISGADIVTALIKRNGRIEQRKPRRPWLYAHHAYVSEHSVGSLIRRQLHEKFGIYSKRYPIGADVLFLKKVCLTPGIKVTRPDFVAGTFGSAGTSREDRAGAICDYFRAQLETENNKYLQVILFAAKILKNARSMVRIK